MTASASPGWMVPSARLWRMRLTQVAAAGPVLTVADREADQARELLDELATVGRSARSAESAGG